MWARGTLYLKKIWLYSSESRESLVRDGTFHSWNLRLSGTLEMLQSKPLLQMRKLSVYSSMTPCNNIKSNKEYWFWGWLLWIQMFSSQCPSCFALGKPSELSEPSFQRYSYQLAVKIKWSPTYVMTAQCRGYIKGLVNICLLPSPHTPFLGGGFKCHFLKCICFKISKCLLLKFKESQRI